LVAASLRQGLREPRVGSVVRRRRRLRWRPLWGAAQLPEIGRLPGTSFHAAAGRGTDQRPIRPRVALSRRIPPPRHSQADLRTDDRPGSPLVGCGPWPPRSASTVHGPSDV